MEKEIKLSDKIKGTSDNEMFVNTDDLPITIVYEGRKKYILKLTSNDCLVLNKKD